MQRIIQINIAGRVIPIEEDAYIVLKEYLNTLDRHFAGEEGKDEIVQDIENRISELFTIRLQNGSPAIDRQDVQKVIDTLGDASSLNDAGNNDKQYSGANSNTYVPPQPKAYQATHYRLLRNPYDKMIGGVCSGLAIYFDIDPVIVRLIMAVLFLTAGIGFITYIIAWIVIPAARTPEELRTMTEGGPMTFHDISRNVQDELSDLKKRGEQMSKELKDFFSKKK